MSAAGRPLQTTPDQWVEAALGEIEEHGAGGHRPHLVDAALARTVVGPERVGGKAVVDQPLVVDVAQGVHVGDRVRRHH